MAATGLRSRSPPGVAFDDILTQAEEEMSGQESGKGLSIRELPRSERPRERLVDLGAQALSSAELLAILMGSGGVGRTAVQLGHAVLADAGGALRALLVNRWPR